MGENIEAAVSEQVFEQLRSESIAKKYIEIIERLINNFQKDDVVQVFRNMLLDHDVCCKIVSNEKNIEDFYERIIQIINKMDQGTEE